MGTDVQGSTATNITSNAAAVQQAEGNMFFCSMEQLYSPILIRRGLPASAQDNISAFEPPEDTVFTSSVFGGDHIGPTRQELDPYFTTVIDGDDNTPMKQCDYRFSNWFVADPDAEQKETNLKKTSRDIDAAGVAHFRGPSIMSGWGFDHAEIPVPYVYDSDPDAGTVGGYTFDTEFIENRALWRSGPIDLKWDYQRKVWGAGHQILVGVADDDIEAPVNPCYPTCFRMKILRRTLNPDNDPDETIADTGAQPRITNWHLNEEITVLNRDPSLEQPLIKNQVFVIAVRVNYEWLPLWVGCPTAAPCEGGSGLFQDPSGNVITGRVPMNSGEVGPNPADCFCFLSSDEEAILFSKSSSGEDCFPDDDNTDDNEDNDGGWPN